MTEEYWYRVVDSPPSKDTPPTFSTIPLRVLKQTPKGVKIEWLTGMSRQVFHATLNKPAQPTRELAMRDYLYRKRKHALIVQDKLTYLRRVIAALEIEAYTTEHDYAMLWGESATVPPIKPSDYLRHVVTTL